MKEESGPGTGQVQSELTDERTYTPSSSWPLCLADGSGRVPAGLCPQAARGAEGGGEGVPEPEGEWQQEDTAPASSPKASYY